MGGAHPVVQRVLVDPDARGHIHHREAALEHLLHRFGHELIRVLLTMGQGDAGSNHEVPVARGTHRVTSGH